MELPSAATPAAYAGTYDGDEGQYGPNPGDPFVKAGGATMVRGADGALSYKGTTYSVSSACIDKVAGPYGKILYLVAGILFIRALRGLSSPASSRRGNMFGMVGMAIAIVTTLAVATVSDWLRCVLIIPGLGVSLPDGFAEKYPFQPGSGEFCSVKGKLLLP